MEQKPACPHIRNASISLTEKVEGAARVIASCVSFMVAPRMRGMRIYSESLIARRAI